jgi:hypothetical protein
MFRHALAYAQARSHPFLSPSAQRLFHRLGRAMRCLELLHTSSKFVADRHSWACNLSTYIKTPAPPLIIPSFHHTKTIHNYTPRPPLLSTTIQHSTPPYQPPTLHPHNTMAALTYDESAMASNNLPPCPGPPPTRPLPPVPSK